MDELEISGKRYISTRRAAKEYKYHSDYIGQLIRGKKLLGRKVGRSWYVDLDSITEFFGKEGGQPPAQLVEAPVVAKAVEEKVEKKTEPEVEIEPAPVAAPVVERKIEPVVLEKIVEEKVELKKVDESSRDAIHIPIRVHRPSFDVAPIKRTATLTYVSDDAPFIPLSRKTSPPLPATVVMPRTAEEAEEVIEEKQIGVEKSSRSILPVFGVVALGALVLIIMLGSSILVSSHTVIEAGKSASVGYTLQ